MNTLKITGALLAATLVVGCGSDKKSSSKSKTSDSSAKTEACCEKQEACCEAPVVKKVTPRYLADAEGAVLLEPQALIKTAIAIYETQKDKLSTSDAREFDEGLATARKLGFEEITWVALSGSGENGVLSAYYPRSLDDVRKAVETEAGESVQEVEFDGLKGFEVSGVSVVKAGDVVLVSPSREDLVKQAAAYASGEAETGVFAELQPSETGILTAKIPSVPALINEIGPLFPMSDIAMFVPDAERILKNCASLKLSLTTDGLSLTLEAGSADDAQALQSALDNLIMMAKMSYKSNNTDLVAGLPSAVKDQLPTIDAAVESLACTQEGKLVTLAFKADLLNLASTLASAFAN